MRAVLVLGALAVLLLGASANPTRRGKSTRPGYIICGESSECGTWECCMLGMGRFSLPRCVPLSDLGDSCRPDEDQPTNATLSYPDGSEVFLPAVHRVICPCSPGLVCDPTLAVCTTNDYADHDPNDLKSL